MNFVIVDLETTFCLHFIVMTPLKTLVGLYDHTMIKEATTMEDRRREEEGGKKKKKGGRERNRTCVCVCVEQKDFGRSYGRLSGKVPMLY